MARRPAPDTRDRILAVASRLFRDRGARAIGTQQLVSETGLGKSLFYREFHSKDELIAAWLRGSDAAWWTRVEAHLRRYEDDPARQLLALVELVDQSARAPDFHGCIFYNTRNEFREPTHPGNREAVAHLNRMRDRLRSLARAARATEPAVLADALMLIIGGIYANAAALGPNGPAWYGVPAAKAVIEQHLPGPGRRRRASRPARPDPARPTGRGGTAR